MAHERSDQSETLESSPPGQPRAWAPTVLTESPSACPASSEVCFVRPGWQGLRGVQRKPNPFLCSSYSRRPNPIRQRLTSFQFSFLTLPLQVSGKCSLLPGRRFFTSHWSSPSRPCRPTVFKDENGGKLGADSPPLWAVGLKPAPANVLSAPGP